MRKGLGEERGWAGEGIRLEAGGSDAGEGVADDEGNEDERGIDEAGWEFGGRRIGGLNVSAESGLEGAGALGEALAEALAVVPLRGGPGALLLAAGAVTGGEAGQGEPKHGREAQRDGAEPEGAEGPDRHMHLSDCIGKNAYVITLAR
jgi:hypothetical protein